LLLCLAGCGETERPVQSTEQFRQSLQDIEKQQPHAGKQQQRAR
jgi:hypothetical protein